MSLWAHRLFLALNSAVVIVLVNSLEVKDFSLPALQADAIQTYDLTHLPFDTNLLRRQSRSRSHFPFPKWPQWTDIVNTVKMSSTSRKKPFLWIHIHKAGGTFMCELARNAGEKIVMPADAACNWKGRDQYRDSGRAHISCEKRLSYFTKPANNFSWGQIEREFAEQDRCWDQFEYGTMLREPISLLLSEINYHPGCFMFGLPCGGGPKDPDGFLKSLEAVLEQPPEHGGTDQFPLWKFFDNIQIRLLAPALEVPPGKINATHLAQAKRTLGNLTVVRLEDMPTKSSTLSFFAKLGWSPDMFQYIGSPVNPSTHDFEFSEEQVSWLQQVNRWDMELWKSYAGGRHKDSVM